CAKRWRTAGSAINAAEAPHILRFLYWYTDHKLGRDKNVKAKRSEPQPAPAPAAAPVSKEVVPSLAPPPAVAPLAPSVSSETQGEGAP
ncbi:MAG: hypothetical protein RLZZ450_6666, partial [Pseudomonadota bacterium]